MRQIRGVLDNIEAICSRARSRTTRCVQTVDGLEITLFKAAELVENAAETRAIGRFRDVKVDNPCSHRTLTYVRLLRQAQGLRTLRICSNGAQDYICATKLNTTDSRRVFLRLAVFDSASPKLHHALLRRKYFATFETISDQSVTEIGSCVPCYHSRVAAVEPCTKLHMASLKGPLTLIRL